MRKITKESVKAFFNNYNYNKNNTSVYQSKTGSAFYLHGNLIAFKYNKERILSINNCGWFSNTVYFRILNLSYIIYDESI